MISLDIIPTLKEVNPQKIYGKTVIVLDIFRCTSTVVTALANGCKEVVPVLNPANAIEAATRYPQGSTVIAGEINGAKIPEFILGNSPLEFTEEVVGGKTVILTTTNGADAIINCKPAKHVLIGSFLNVSSVCSRAVGYNKDIVIVCSGTRGNIALEDVMSAGCHVDILKRNCQNIRITDLAETLYYLYLHFKNHLTRILSTSRSGINLRKLGYERDIDFCLQEDVYKIVPVFKQNSIKLTQPITLHNTP